MKILFTRFPLESCADGGAERQVVTLMEGLIARNNAVAFAGSCKALLTLCRARHIPSTELVIGPPPVSKWHAVSFAWRRRGMQRKLQTLLNGFHDLDAIVMLSFSEKLLLTPLVTEVQHSRTPKILWIEHDPVGRWLTTNPWLPHLKKASQYATIVTVSEMSKQLYINMGFDPNRVVAIPNGIDLKRFEPPPPSPTLPPEGEGSMVNRSVFPSPPGERARGGGGEEGEGLGEGGRVEHTDKALHIGSVARLDREKGLDLLIEAVKELTNVSLTIVGQGKEERKLKNIIAELGGYPRATGGEGESPVPHSGTMPTSQPRNLAGADEEARGWAEGLWRAVRFLLLLFFVGQTKKSRTDDTAHIRLLPRVYDLGAFYRSLDLFVLPSRTNDPFGLVAAEAMSLGVPVVVTDACGIASYVKDGENAVIVKADDAMELREGIESLRNPQKRRQIGAKGKTVAANEFSVHRMVERYEALLEKSENDGDTIIA